MRPLGFYLNRSIRTKLTAVMIAGLGAVATFIIIFFPARQKHLAFQELKTKSISLARILAYNVSPGLEFEDLEAVQEAVSGVQADCDVIDLHVMDNEGRQYYRYQRRGKPPWPHDFRFRQNEILELSDRLVVSTRIYANQRQIGALILEVSTLGVLTQIKENRRLTIVVSLVLFLMGIALSSFLAGHLTRPLLQLTATTRKVSSGDLSYRIDIKAEDEIGHLASAFNKMISSLSEAQQKNQLYLQKIERSNLVLQKQRKEIEAYSHTLERRVEERTAKLNQAYEVLSQKNKELEETLEALKKSQEQVREAERLAVIGEIAGRVAHEVLNPITALLSRTQTEIDYLNISQRAVAAMKDIIAEWQENHRAGNLPEYLLQESGGETNATYAEEDLAILSQAIDKSSSNLKRGQDFFSFFEHQIMRVVKIIDNLREMSRAKRELEEVDVNECLKEVAELFEEGLRKRHINLTPRLGPNLGRVYVDHTELFQVFSNLLRNAMQAIETTGSGKGQITFSSEAVGEEVWVRVVDDGVGIAEEHKSLIFRPDFSTKSRKEGTGLGLSISRRLVGDMGGELILESSQRGAGATFLVKLPSVSKPRATDPERMDKVQSLV